MAGSVAASRYTFRARRRGGAGIPPSSDSLTSRRRVRSACVRNFSPLFAAPSHLRGTPQQADCCTRRLVEDRVWLWTRAACLDLGGFIRPYAARSVVGKVSSWCERIPRGRNRQEPLMCRACWESAPATQGGGNSVDPSKKMVPKRGPYKPYVKNAPELISERAKGNLDKKCFGCVTGC